MIATSNLIHPFPKDVIRKDPEHIYENVVTGKNPISVSKLLDLFEQPFDKNKQSFRSAQSQLRKEGKELSMQNLAAKAGELRDEWSQKGQVASDLGTEFHYAMEVYLSTGKIAVPKWEKQIRRFSLVFGEFYRTYTEIIVYDDNVAGTADCLSEHSSKRRNLLHIRDFKTNKEKPHPDLQYNKWMKHGLSHLPQNKYTRYCIQQSLYASLLSKHGYNFGTLSLYWIDMIKVEQNEEIFWEEIPMLWLKYEAEYMLDYARTIQYNP